MFLLQLKNSARIFFALFVCTALLLLFSLLSVSKFPDLDGKRTFFLDSASSQGLRKDCISILDIFRVKGECVRLDACQYNAESLLVRYQAEVLFKEEVAGRVSYYCYTEKWGGGLCINGYKVNLHIAVGEEEMVVGFPIIFDGY